MPAARSQRERIYRMYYLLATFIIACVGSLAYAVVAMRAIGFEIE